MAKYVDVDKVRIPKGFFNDLNVPKLLDWLNSQPTADVVPVEWISVKDRLPKTNGKYLCANYSKTFKRHFIEVLSFAKDLHKVDEFDFKEEKGKSGFYMYDSEWGYSHFRNVTRWMPLPEPPKKEGVDNEKL